MCYSKIIINFLIKFDNMTQFFIVFISFFLSFNAFCIGNQPTPSEFLHTSKEQYQLIMNSPENRQKIHFIMGNESADLDSIVSSIAYAYLLTQENPSKDELYIPLLNLYHEELDLRKDTLYLFQRLNISSDDLLFLDDKVPLDQLFSQDRLRLDLVDHNVLRPRQEHLSGAVERIVDHHVDENKTYPLMTEDNKVIAIVGSASTLVAEKMLADSQISITPELATLLLGPVLIDTSNLQSSEKTTERDIHVVETLRPLAETVMPADFYEKLLEAKNDITGLTHAMLLSKDFKEYLDGPILYGISSLPSSISWWIEDESTISSILEKYTKDRNLAYLILLMNNPDPNGPKRKIIVYSPSTNLLKAFDAYAEGDEALHNVLMPAQSDEHLSYYLAVKFVARKQLQPLFHFSQNPNLMAIFEEEIKQLPANPS